MLTNRSLLLSVGVTMFVASTFAVATTQRTFVSANGVDNPNCSIGQPCRTFAAAITATSSGGEIIVQDSAGYGPVTITKSISIISPPGIYGGISVFSGNGVTVNAPGATVVLRGLSINGQGGANGILVQQAARVRIESCVVSNMGGVGIYHQADNAEMIVLDTISRDNGDGGFALVAKDASIVLDHVRSEHNQNDGFYIAPTPGSSTAKAVISDSLLATNGGNGVWADTVGGAVTFLQVQRSVFSKNAQKGAYATAGASGAQAYLTLTRNAFDLDGGPNGTAIYSLATFGVAAIRASENSFISSYVTADGTNSNLYITGNSGGATVTCANGGTIYSYGNNTLFANCPVLKLGTI